MVRRPGMTRRDALRLGAAGLTCPVAGQPAHAQGAVPVDLNLALAVDASGSVNRIRFDLQRRGYAEAFEDPRILAAIRSGQRAAIGVAMFQWTGPQFQSVSVPWTRLDSPQSLAAFADAVEAAPRALFGGGTSISGAIDFGVDLIGRAPFEANRHVIDVSGDGANNRGRPAEAARDAAIARGININGLPILELEPDLEEHYRNNVIGGPGAFTIAAATFQDFGAAIRRKLIQEIAGGFDVREADHPTRTG